MATKRFVSKDNLGRVWARLFGKVLNSKEEIEANKSENMIAGADAVKEVYSSFGTLSFGVDSDGNAYYKIGGADTEHPFKSGINKIVFSNTTMASALENHTRIIVYASMYKDDELIDKVQIIDVHVSGNRTAGVIKTWTMPT